MSFQFFSKLDNKITDGPISQIDPERGMRGFAEGSPLAKQERLEDRRLRTLARRTYRAAAKSNDPGTMMNAYKFLEETRRNGGSGAGIARAGYDLLPPAEGEKIKEDQFNGRDSRLGPVQGINRDSGSLLGQPSINRDSGSLLGNTGIRPNNSIVGDVDPGSGQQPSTIDSLTEIARERSGANDLLGVSGNPLLDILGGKPTSSAPTQAPSLIEPRNPFDFPPGQEPSLASQSYSTKPEPIKDTNYDQEAADYTRNENKAFSQSVRDLSSANDAKIVKLKADGAARNEAIDAKSVRDKQVLGILEKERTNTLNLADNKATPWASSPFQFTHNELFSGELGKKAIASENPKAFIESELSKAKDFNRILGGKPTPFKEIDTATGKSTDKEFDSNAFAGLKNEALGLALSLNQASSDGRLDFKKPEYKGGGELPGAAAAREKIIKASIDSGYDISKDKELMAIPDFRKRLEEERVKALPTKGKDGMTTTARKAPTMKLGYDMA